MSFDRRGYAISDLVLTAAVCESVASELPVTQSRRGGVRDLLRSGIVRRLLADRRLSAAIREHVDGPLVAVKATLFDKTHESNWRVQWHQDRVVALAERRDIPGFDCWTRKNDVPHAGAPRELLDQMLAVRIHLDPSGADNGPLRVIPGSHLRGNIAAEEIPGIVRDSAEVELTLPRSSILLMRPLLLHASAPAVDPAHRRVLHIELGPPELAGGLRWHDSVELDLA